LSGLKLPSLFDYIQTTVFLVAPIFTVFLVVASSLPLI